MTDEPKIVRVPTGHTIEAESGAYVHEEYEVLRGPWQLDAPEVTTEGALNYIRTKHSAPAGTPWSDTAAMRAGLVPDPRFDDPRFDSE